MQLSMTACNIHISTIINTTVDLGFYLSLVIETDISAASYGDHLFMTGEIFIRALLINRNLTVLSCSSPMRQSSVTV